ncbi:MAG: HEAT repeat domain-containing protein [Planctomycetota bacterium]|nr:HEAT repeat domain-containing protein [Planctomycetota bacterium]MDA1213852.1 HEAT repeat domain-containing protein [Planctomycetota bacterium]
MNAPLARLKCEACGSQVMPALVRCPDCGTPLHKKKLPDAAFAIRSSQTANQGHPSESYPSPKTVTANDLSLNEMLSMAAPVDASTSARQFAPAQHVLTSHDHRPQLPSGVSSPFSTDLSQISSNRSIGAAQSPKILTIACSCGKLLRARWDQAGKRVRCPSCKQPVLIEDSSNVLAPSESMSSSSATDSVISGPPSGSSEISYSFVDASKNLPTVPLLAVGDQETTFDGNPPTKKVLSRNQHKKLVAKLIVDDPASQDEAVARRQAIQELGEAGETSAIDDILVTVDDPWIPVREAAATALGALKNPQATATLIRMLGDEAASVCRAAITALGSIGDGRAVESLVHLSVIQPHRKAQVSDAIGSMKASAIPELLKLLKHSDPGIVLDTVVLLGHLRDRLATEALIPFLNSELTILQAHAAESLGKIGDPKAIVPLCQAAQSRNAGVRANAVAALALSGDKRTENILLSCLQDRDVELRYHAVKGLGNIGDAKHLSSIVPLLADENDRVRGALAEAFGRLVDSHCVEPLLHLLQDPQENVRVKAATSIKKYHDQRIVSFLINGLNDQSETVQLRCIDALGEHKSPDVIIPLVSKLTVNRSVTIRAAAAKALGEVGDEAAVDNLIDALKDEYSVRCKVIVSLGQIASQKSLPALLSQVKDSIPEIRYHTAMALGKMDNQYARMAIEKLLEDSSPMVRKCAARVLADLGDEHAAALLKDDSILKRKPRPSIKKAFSGFQMPSIGETIRESSIVSKIVAGSALVLMTGVILGVTGLLPSSLSGMSAHIPVIRGNIADIAFSADGQQIAVARTRRLLEVWKQGEKTPALQTELSCQGISFTPHPQLLLLANGEELLTWNRETPDAPPKGISKFNSVIKYLSATPDHKFAATWTADGVVRIWNLATNREVQNLPLPVPNSQVIALSPDARVLVSGTAQGSLVFWDVSSRKTLSEIPGLNSPVTALAFSRDGKRFAAGTKKGDITVWEYQSGKTLANVSNGTPVKALWVDNSRDIVIALSEPSVRRWNWTDGSKIDFPPTDAEAYSSLASSPDGKTIAVGGTTDSPLWLFDIDTGTLIETLDVEP